MNWSIGERSMKIYGYVEFKGPIKSGAKITFNPPDLDPSYEGSGWNYTFTSKKRKLPIYSAQDYDFLSKYKEGGKQFFKVTGAKEVVEESE